MHACTQKGAFLQELDAQTFVITQQVDQYQSYALEADTQI